jgi:hypothetical protein
VVNKKIKKQKKKDPRVEKNNVTKSKAFKFSKRNMSAAITKKISSIELQFSKLRLMLEEKESKKAEKKSSAPRKRKDKPESIDKCKTKSDLAKFTVKELKDWIKENEIDTKKLSEKHKEDLVKLVWKKLNASAESSEESSSSDSSSDSGSSESD